MSPLVASSGGPQRRQRAPVAPTPQAPASLRPDTLRDTVYRDPTAAVCERALASSAGNHVLPPFSYHCACANLTDLPATLRLQLHRVRVHYAV